MKNNCIDISSDKLTRSNMRGLGYGYEIETLNEKVNFFSHKH